mmetsp:Transcript_31123/g.83539  ORF Transcript_31123/g.83539 Transcript_31123/m.83539 type:complete len:117 (+) Transcript_31123:261-611(+)
MDTELISGQMVRYMRASGAETSLQVRADTFGMTARVMRADFCTADATGWECILSSVVPLSWATSVKMFRADEVSALFQAGAPFWANSIFFGLTLRLRMLREETHMANGPLPIGIQN